MSTTLTSLLAATRAPQAAGAGVGPDLMAVPVPSHWPAQRDLISWCQTLGPGVAALAIILGIVYLLFGFNLFRWLVVLNAACLGLAVGLMLGDKTGGKIPLGVVGAVLAGAVAWPTMKWAVAIMGGTFGALVGATVWRMVDLDPSYTWSGAMIGLVVFGLLCFILFRGCVMMYTSLQGAVMLIFGILSLLLKAQDLAPKLGTYLTGRPFLLPMAVFIPTVVGMMYQQAYGGAGAPKPAGGAAPAKK